MTALRYCRVVHDFLVWALAVVAAAIAGGLVVLICADVLARNLRLGTIPWTNEATEYGLYGMTLLAAPWVLSLGAHVRMDLVPRVLPAGGARVLETVAALVGAAITGILSWYGVVVTLAAHARGALILKTLVFPEWILLAFLPFTLMLLTIGFLMRAADIIVGDRPVPGADSIAGAG